MTDPANISAHQRQIHLDFHTSPLIPQVAADFDPITFAQTMHDAHVNSVTIFAKCHHGMCYYPTKTGIRHPTLQRPDLLGEMIEALHRKNIRAPIYTTVGWEEDVAQRFPAWRQQKKDGAFARHAHDPKTPTPGGWRFNNFLHPDYQNYIEAHVRELLENYPIDGLFFDILFFDRDACWSDASMKFRQDHNLLSNDDQTHLRFTSLAQESFAARFTRLIHGRHPKASIFYNMPNVLQPDHTLGSPGMHPHRTHWEIESLPSGFWGYYHFPRLARRAIRANQPWIGQTGRFQKMWGDFGGIKPQPALEFECFRTQALGGACGIGDQLHPRGRLDPNAYKLIGNVYAQCAAVEPFYANTHPMPQVGILASGGPGIPPTDAELSLEGAVQMCEESHYDAAVIDDSCALDDLDLLILPDSGVLTDALLAKLQVFHARGGKLLISANAARLSNGQWALPREIPLEFGNGNVDHTPTYWRTRPDFAPALCGSDRVIYSPGLAIFPSPGTPGEGRGEGDFEHREPSYAQNHPHPNPLPAYREREPRQSRILIDRVQPYFKHRTDLTFCSHFQAPPQPDIDKQNPAALAGQNWVYFADPIFREYRKTGNLAPRDAWKAAMHLLIGPPPIGQGLPTTILLYPRRHNEDLRLTLLHYVPLRKALDIDVLEEPMSFANETLRFTNPIQQVKIIPTNESLPRQPDGSFTLPIAKGRLLLEVPNYFRP